MILDKAVSYKVVGWSKTLPYPIGLWCSVGRLLYSIGLLINGFLDLEYRNFDTKHGFLSSIEA